jgi:hypothetical protein
MPFKKSHVMRYYKITVWFKTGVKSYTIAPAGFKDFVKNLKARSDVIKYVVESTYKHVF